MAVPGVVACPFKWCLHTRWLGHRVPHVKFAAWQPPAELLGVLAACMAVRAGWMVVPGVVAGPLKRRVRTRWLGHRVPHLMFEAWQPPAELLGVLAA